MAYALEDLTTASLGRQFPDRIGDVGGVVDLVTATGPVQSQTARAPFIGLAARRPGTTHAEVTAAYVEGRLVRGSTIRGTVHTATPEQYAALGAATRVGQRALWQRLLKLERTRKPRRSELAAPIAALEAALDITITGVSVTREAA